VGQAIGESLPLSVGVAISPIPIIAIILMLLSKRAGSNSTAFFMGWSIGVTGVVVAVVALAGAGGAGTPSKPASWEAWLRIGLGVLLLVLAGRDWRKRPKAGQEPELPKWLSTIESTTPPKALGLGVLLSAVNPKNLLLLVAGGTAIAQGTNTLAPKIGAVVVFVVVAVSSVALPVVLYWVLGERAQRTLNAMNHWLRANNAVVMAVLVLVFGVVLIGKGIGGL
jgi:threonine/homoserine/homoserine lactone efflux protein